MPLLCASGLRSPRVSAVTCRCHLSLVPRAVGRPLLPATLAPWHLCPHEATARAAGCRAARPTQRRGHGPEHGGGRVRACGDFWFLLQLLKEKGRRDSNPRRHFTARRGGEGWEKSPGELSSLCWPRGACRGVPAEPRGAVGLGTGGPGASHGCGDTGTQVMQRGCPRGSWSHFTHPQGTSGIQRKQVWADPNNPGGKSSRECLIFQPAHRGAELPLAPLRAAPRSVPCRGSPARRRGGFLAQTAAGKAKQPERAERWQPAPWLPWEE